MKDIERYKITSANGNSSNVTKCDDGHWVHYSEIEQLQARIKELKSETSKLGATCEEYSWKINKLEHVNHINEIKAQGIEEGIKYIYDTLGYPYDVDEEFLNKYIEKLRNNNEKND